jgi:sugar O-acyltransferase (sialic acid O-acetyltransferase NeuD family)
VKQHKLYKDGVCMREQIVIVGAGEFAEIAYEYFSQDSPNEVVAFAVEKVYLNRDKLCGLPVVEFESIETRFSPDRFKVFVALTYTQLNRARARLFMEAKSKGYRLASYVSSKAFVWRTVELGENVFIFENNVIQHGAKIGHNVIIWSGNHIGHRTVVSDHCYIASHVVISGYCTIGERCFLGVNCTVADHVKIAKDCVVGAGALILNDTKPTTIYPGLASQPSRVSSLRFYKIKNE